MPDFYVPANPVYNVTRIPGKGSTRLVMVFQIPTNTYNLEFLFQHSGSYSTSIGLLLEPQTGTNDDFSYPTFDVISEGPPGIGTAYRVLSQTIGQPQPLPGSSPIVNRSEIQNCTDQTIPYVLETRSYARTETSTSEKLKIAPKYELTGALSADLGLLALRFVRSIESAFNLRISLGEYQKSSSFNEVLEDTISQTINIEIPAQQNLVITESRQSAKTPITYTFWIADRTYEVTESANGMLITREWRLEPCTL